MDIRRFLSRFFWDSLVRVAIGASFKAGEAIGLVTAFTILFHEILHKMGDFTILVRDGMSKTKAFLEGS